MRLKRTKYRWQASITSALESIPLSAPWTVEEFCQWLERERGKTVSLLPRDADTSSILKCGTLYVMPDELAIKYSAQYSPRHQRQQIFHEIAHVLCDHRGEDVYDVPESTLTDGIDPSRVQEILRRSSFSTSTEAEAELLGTALAVLSRGDISGDRNGSLHRSAAIIEYPRR